MANNFYITTTLPYVNADPHIGFAMELVRADVIARYRRQKGDDVFFNTGTDEHGIKIFRKAEEAGLTTQEYVDGYAQKFMGLTVALGTIPDIHFVRTTDQHHIKAAQEFWKRCAKRGYIEKRPYQAKYCSGCELEKTDSELDGEGKCPLHPNIKIELIDEENYFFKFSAFRDELLALYNGRPDFVVPDFRFNEIKAFVERGLEDFSISRLKEKMPWGTPVPGNPDHVMYVWFDALVSYISTIGWPKSAKEPLGLGETEGDFEKWWPVVQYCGKDNLRQQSAMWQAMLMAADLPPSRQIVVDGFINVDGKKMSKSLGNVVDPFALVTDYGRDVVRYYIIRELSPFEDGDYTEEKFKNAYNGNLANGLGNLLSRTLTMAVSLGGTIKKGEPLELPYVVHGFGVDEKIEGPTIDSLIDGKIIPQYEVAMAGYEQNRAADAVWELIGFLDSVISRTEPFKLIKTDPARAEVILYGVLSGLHTVATLLEPMLPDTAEKMHEHIGIYTDAKPDAFIVKKLEAPLFPRR